MKKRFSVRMDKVNEEVLNLHETLFHNANGYLGVRGTPEEGYPEGFHTMRGMYINGFYDIAPMKQAEKLCNLVEDKESIVNVADTQTIRLSFGGQDFSMLEGKLLNYERILDMDRGVTIRKVDWKTSAGARVDFDVTRMTSFVDRALFAIDYRFTSVDFEGEVEIESLHRGLVQNYFNPDDPRLAGEQHEHLQKKAACMEEKASYLVSETVTSQLSVASAVAHEIYINGEKHSLGMPQYDDGRHEAVQKTGIFIKAGDVVRIVKYTVISDSVRSGDCLSDARTHMGQVLQNGLEKYYAQQAAYLKDFWENSEMEIEGDDDLNAAVCFNMYQLLQSAGQDGYSSIAAKGLSGEGYEGHYFWDTEIFMLPYFALTNPQIARKLLEYRYTTLPRARENATLLGHAKGALYPWRTITGRECSGYFPSGTAQYHIDGDIAYAVVLYYKTVKDWDFIKEKGLEILLETGRLWMDTGSYYGGTFHINCVTGPDEYTCMVNNNYYTNASAKYNLEWLLYFAGKLKKEEKEWKEFCERLEVTEGELQEMQWAAEHMYLPYDKELGINPQDDSFLEKPKWDFEKTDTEKYPLLLHYHPLHLYRYQVCKQADTVLSYFLFPDYQDRKTMENSFLYYEKITTHDSSLSTCVFSIVASMLGMHEKAYTYFGDSAKLDILNTHKNTKDGIHAANMGGCYMAIVYGFAMLRSEEGMLSLMPYLPPKWKQYRFRVCYQGRRLEICVNKNGCQVTLLEGETLPVRIYTEKYTLIRDRILNVEKERCAYVS